VAGRLTVGRIGNPHEIIEIEPLEVPASVPAPSTPEPVTVPEKEPVPA
jgi:hypothetical protein